MIPSRFEFPSLGFDSYWKNGRGKYLLKSVSKLPEKKEIEAKIIDLLKVDTIADKVVEEVFLKIGFVKTHQLLNEIFSKGITNIPNVPISLQLLFEEVNLEPSWLDWNKIELGAAFCRRSNVLGLIVLRNYSLMGGYESSAINKPLIFTEALKKGAAKRIAETTEFWINVVGKSALKNNQIGFQHTINVRLMHAYARVSILKMPDWKTEKWGLPLNHWDMKATNLGFSIVFLDGLVKLGFRPTNEEIDALFHLWKYIGFLLGIPAEILPNSKDEAISQLYEWTISQPSADEDTIALAQALYIEPTLAKFPKKVWQRKIVQKVNLGYNHYFLEAVSSKRLGLPKTVWKIYPRMIQFFNSRKEFFVQKSPKFKKKSEMKGRKTQIKIGEIIKEMYGSRN